MRMPEGLSGSEGADVAVLRKRTSKWTLWIVAASCALHVMEEYFTGWQVWARETLGIVMPTTRFLVINPDKRKCRDLSSRHSMVVKIYSA